MSQLPHQTLPDGWRVIHLTDVDSTNAEVARLTADDQLEGLVVIADRQTAGRGRRGRNWESPEGNLYLSVLLDAPLAVAGQAGFAAALAISDTLSQFLPDRAQLKCKWPNDVLLDGGKLAGLLLEALTGRDQVVLGIGLNVMPMTVADANYPVASLAEAGVDLAAEDLVAPLCRCLEFWLTAWRQRGFGAIRTAWLAQASGLGYDIEVRLPTESLSGRFAGLAPDGSLLLDQGSLGTRKVSAGEVFFTSVNGG